jgi:hypothetical protein
LVEHKGALFLLGGYDNHTGKNLHELWTSTDGLNWAALPVDKQFAARHGATVVSLSDGILVAGGNIPRVTNEVWKIRFQ